jgi:hypothetical protein
MGPSMTSGECNEQEGAMTREIVRSLSLVGGAPRERLIDVAGRDVNDRKVADGLPRSEAREAVCWRSAVRLWTIRRVQ